MKYVRLLLSTAIAACLVVACSTKPSEDAVEESAEETVDALPEPEDTDEYDAMEETGYEDGDAMDDEGQEVVEVAPVGDEGGDFYTDANGNIVYTFLMEEDRPAFRDGTLEDYMKDHLVYPLESKENSSEGTVVVDFIVNADGTVSGSQVVKAVDDELLNAEALKIVEGMPDWIPGQKDGVPVAYRYSLPVHFVLE